MQHINEYKLYSDLVYRYKYICDFLDFGEKDIALVHASASILAPRLTDLVDAVYDKLFSFDCTKRIFYGEKEKHDSEVDNSSSTLDNYDQNKPQIGMRKGALKLYLTRLVTKPYDGNMLNVLDRMGSMHRIIKVELIHLQILLIFVQDAIIAELYNYKNSSQPGEKV
eukprot:sb/3472403/